MPVIRNAESLSVAEIEKTIADFGKRAKDGTLTMADMAGGTFTISNGGVFGIAHVDADHQSAPVGACLGFIVSRTAPVVVNGQIVIRPMMYLALSYDHRLVDGREAGDLPCRDQECDRGPDAAADRSLKT